MYVPLTPTFIHIYFWVVGIMFMLSNNRPESLNTALGIFAILMLMDSLFIIFGIINGSISYRIKRVKDNWALRVLRAVVICMILYTYFGTPLPVPINSGNSIITFAQCIWKVIPPPVQEYLQTYPNVESSCIIKVKLFLILCGFDWILYRLIQLMNCLKCYVLLKKGDTSIGRAKRFSVGI